jgi:predicted RNase H-like HicB family nuclease
MSKPNDAIDLTVVYEDAGAGRLTATLPALPGTISWGRTQAEARSNVVDALRTMLSVEPEKIPDGARAERVRVTLGIARRQTRDLGLDRSLRDGRTRSSHGSIRA